MSTATTLGAIRALAREARALTARPDPARRRQYLADKRVLVAELEARAAVEPKAGQR